MRRVLSLPTWRRVLEHGRVLVAGVGLLSKGPPPLTHLSHPIFPFKP